MGRFKPNNSVAGITYDQNAEEGGWSALSEEEIAAALNSKVRLKQNRLNKTL